MSMQQVSKHGIRHWIGFMFREAGESLDRVGCWLQGSLAYKEPLNRHRRVMNFAKHTPTIGNGVFIAPSAHVIGNVSIGDKASIWYNAIVRGDVNNIKIGNGSNLQDRVVVHVSSKKGYERGTEIGNNVTVESGSVLHACTLKDESYIGIGATILDNAVVGKRSMVAPSSVVAPNTIIPDGQLWSGTPAKFVRELTAQEQASIPELANELSLLAEEHNKENNKELEQLLREIERVEYREDKLAHYVYTPPQQS
jgi:carbonic anhydrase/acetyltransferase-like protein (isoleucine patch superfamily)